MRRREIAFLMIFALLPVVQGCDSGDPIDNTPPITQPVAGTYVFQELAVVPDASRIPPLNMLDTLVAGDTRLQLFEGGDFVLTYRYEGGVTAAVFGRYTNSARDVRLTGESTQSDVENLRGLIMGEQLILQRSPGALAGSFRKTVDMAALSDGYEGIPPLSATVRIRLQESTQAGAEIRFR